MKGLILSDFFMMKKTYAMYLLIGLVYTVIGVANKNSSMVTAFFILFGMMSTPTVFAWNEQCKWDVYANTLPLRRKDYVGAKFVLGIMTMGAMLLWGAAVIIFNILVNHSSGEEELCVLAVTGAVGGIYMAILFMLIFKLGVERSRIVMIALYIIPFLTVMALEKSGLIPEIPDMSSRMVWLAVGGLVLLAAVLMVVSYAVCLNIYKKKEL